MMQAWERDQLITAALSRYGTSVSWEITKTFKGNRKLDFTDPNRSDRYTMFVFDENLLIMQSDEQQGSHKSGWYGNQWGTFMATLKEV
jgi:hypothetical protein